MTVRDVVALYVIDNDYDGLFCAKCFCGLPDLASVCVGDIRDCKPGYKKMVCKGGWIVVEEKPGEGEG